MSLRRILQRETSDLHQALDALILDLKCFESRSAYGRWLIGMHGFHVRIREALEESCAGADHVCRQDERIDRLEQDLEALTVPLGIGAPAYPLAVSDPASVLGIRYVVEGASLGSRVLFGRAMAIGLTPTRGARYLAAERASLSSWHVVLTELEAAELDTVATGRAVEASRRAFGLAAHCLGGFCHA